MHQLIFSAVKHSVIKEPGRAGRNRTCADRRPRRRGSPLPYSPLKKQKARNRFSDPGLENCRNQDNPGQVAVSTRSGIFAAGRCVASVPKWIVLTIRSFILPCFEKQCKRFFAGRPCRTHSLTEPRPLTHRAIRHNSHRAAPTHSPSRAHPLTEPQVHTH